MAKDKEQQQPKGMSMRPSSYSEGGLLDNVDVRWIGCRFEMWDYNGKIPQAIPALKIDMEIEDDGGEIAQYYSAGSGKDWLPSKDGLKLIAVGSVQSLNKSSRVAILINSLVAAGFPEDKIEDNVSVFEGLECHMVRVPGPKRAGLTRSPRPDGRTFDETVLVADKIIKLPWEKDAGDMKSPSVPPGSFDADLESKASEAIVEILTENPSGIDKKKLVATLFSKLKADPQRNAIIQLAYRDDFLSSGAWNFDRANGMVFLG